MIDFTTIPLFEALPDVKALNYQNMSLIEDNRLLKRVITAMVIAVIIYWYFQSKKTVERRNETQ